MGFKFDKITSRVNDNRLVWIKVLLVFFLLNFATNLFSENSQDCPYVILRSRKAGMFSIFCDVVGVLKYYEEGKYSGVKVDFESTGFYFEREYGKNWWEYYCEPIEIGEKRNGKVLKLTLQNIGEDVSYRAERQMTRLEVYELIEKYIHVKPHIEEIVNTFKENYFKEDLIIGVHYRGTDKKNEACRVHYNDVQMAINEVINQHKGINYQIFVATDEQSFIKYITKLYKEKVCYQVENIRSNDYKPIHYNYPCSKYQAGQEALLDCLLLSNCDILIRTSSNLSLWSGFFNPFIEEIVLNQRHKSKR